MIQIPVPHIWSYFLQNAGQKWHHNNVSIENQNFDNIQDVARLSSKIFSCSFQINITAGLSYQKPTYNFDFINWSK